MKKTWNAPMMEELSIAATANGIDVTADPDGSYVDVLTPCGWKHVALRGSCK
ncbi:MAG: hypothetical protein Q4F05_03880 [bacterium]|nr:hypothetical protein [bacterium]